MSSVNTISDPETDASAASREAPFRPGLPPDVRRLLLARSLRAFGDGYIAILLPLHLTQLGFDAFAVGARLDGDPDGLGPAHAGRGLVAHRVRRRSALLGAALLMALTGLGFAGVEAFWPLLVIAFVGTLNPSGGDVSVFLPLEHTVIAHVVADEDRTAVFARYSFVGALLGALGALSAGAVDWLAPSVAPGTVITPCSRLYGALGIAHLRPLPRALPGGRGRTDALRPRWDRPAG